LKNIQDSSSLSAEVQRTYGYGVPQHVVVWMTVIESIQAVELELVN
jgi:hypothetical protein